MAREIVMPRLSDSMEEGTILKWLVAAGDEVSEGTPLVEVETDKAVVTHEADGDGVVLALSAAEGETVAVGAPIAVIGARGEELPASAEPATAGASTIAGQTASTGVAPSTAAGAAGPPATSRAADTAPAETPEPAAAPAASSAAHAGTGRAKASPLARRIAAKLHVDLSGIVGSGPNGRVIRADVERAAAAGNGHAAPVPAGASAADASGEMVATSAKGETSRQEPTRLQQTVARRMAESRATVPDIELRAEVDMSRAVALRAELRELAPDDAPSLNDFIVKACALALREFPRVNGAYRDAQFETYSRVNVGIAVAADDALVVPTIFDADAKSLAEIGRTARALAARVRDGQIAPNELAGGTFTVSNLGMYGVDSFSAVINPPQSAILAVGAVRPRPIVDEDGNVVARPTAQLTLACDHRILYGVDGARFLARVRELLERPLALML